MSDTPTSQLIRDLEQQNARLRALVKQDEEIIQRRLSEILDMQQRLEERAGEIAELRSRLIMSPGTSAYNRKVTELETQIAAEREHGDRLAALLDKAPGIVKPWTTTGASWSDWNLLWESIEAAVKAHAERRTTKP